MIVTGETLAAPCSAGTAPPRTGMPEGAVDCHMHVFDPRFPYVEGRDPPPGTLEDYRLFQRRMGLERCIVVAASSYGLDNGCLLDTLARLGEKARGIASIDLSVTEDQLYVLHRAGCRGIRFNHGRVKGTSVDGIRRLADRIAPLNWVFQLNMPNPDDLVANADALADLPVPLIIDHLGRAPQPGGLHHPVAGVLERLLAGGNTWVKLSFLYESPTVSLEDYAPLVRHLARIAPDRCIWGSDWNHAIKDTPPDDAEVFDRLSDWIGDEATRRRILVDNPRALYWRERA